MRLVDLNLRPDDRILRQFGWVALVGFGLLAVIAWNEVLIFSAGLGRARIGVTAGLAALGGLSALFSLFHPRANLPAYLGLSLLAYPIGFALSHAFLAVLFYGVFTPVGLVFRLIGRDALKRAAEGELQSYWVDARPPDSQERYFRQF